ncbi:DnaD domain protein [Paenibacillus rhizovicinus]|uniref:DnaD domain protein n=1 Tax=Paenibacillus rhizovicinus TaxID=2704463 RepID=A0A6C0P0A5_9BACL|nr:DnaD domain protein [Paenibacillus rhizovicinus]QHW30142.1 DnaD domain protein [Paenibacillus rhizovicinus]
MKNEMWKAYARGMAAAMNGGSVAVPAGLLRAYRGIGLSDTEMMLMLQLMQFRQVEGIDFPTPEQLADRLGILPKAAHGLLGRLMKEGLLAIDGEVDAVSGIGIERYNWTGFIIRSAEWLAEEAKRTLEQEREAQGGPSVTAAASADDTDWVRPADLFTAFEQEFGRPLSPMECETISAWVDQDRYPDELIRFALKEAVFAGKLHFRYIDRILIEWSRNRVTNTDEAKAHTQKFRSRG